MWYCTLHDARSVMAAGPDSKATDDDLLMSLIRTVSARVNLTLLGSSADYLFLPTTKTRQVLLDSSYINSRLNTLLLPYPLLALTSISADGTAVTGVAAGYPAGATPYRQLRISSSGSPWYSYISTSCGDPAYADITGVWGYHSSYAEAWQDTGLDLSTALAADGASLTTSDVDDENLYGLPPALSRGALIKVDSELMWVLGTNINANTAGIRRGVLGTTAAAHDEESSIYVWQVEESIRHIAARQAAFMYARRGAYEQSSFDGATSVQYPPDLLREMQATLTQYANL
jgi:hypothetical protein